MSMLILLREKLRLFYIENCYFQKIFNLTNMKVICKTKIIQILLLIIASPILLGHCTSRHVRSGFYYDNEENQTVALQLTSRRERRALARSVLQLLDLPIKPPRNRSQPMDGPASRFIRDVYKNALGKEIVGPSKFTDTELKTIEDSDVILTYPALPKLENQSDNTLHFDLSETPPFLNAIKSELRVYVKPSINSTWRISLFDSQDFVDSAKATKEGWIKFNTGKVLKRWFNCTDCNRELHISAVSLNNDVSDKDVLLLDNPEKQAFLVGYFVSLRNFSTQLIVPNVRPDRSAKTKIPRNYLDNPYSGVNESNRRRKTSCSIRSLYVRFRELDFDRYIVEPEGYDARFCQGDCRFPLTARMNATNHALVQTLVHFLRPRLAPRVACAPREHEDLPVFYSRDGKTFVYQIKRQMIVKSCGCC